MSKVELTPAKLADIKKKAEAAKDVKWPTIEQFPQHEEYPAAELIAAADPATVLALVEEIELLKKRLRWFPAHITEKIDLAILVHTGGKETIDARKELCMCDHTVGYYCEFCAVLDALTSCKKATKSEATQ